MTTKIATCCYCGTRTMLKLTAREGHELACGRCGAPLHEMKALKVEPSRPARRAAPTRDPVQEWRREEAYRPRKKKKRKKPLWSRALEEALDVIEDIFD